MRHKTKLIFLQIIFISFALLAQTQPLFIKNGRIMTPGNTSEAPRSLLIDKGRIVAIGADLTAPADAQILDAQGQCVYPGLIAPFTALGLVAYPGSDSDTDEKGGAVQEMDPADAVNPEDDSIAVARIDGITAALTVSGTRQPINGFASLMQLVGELGSDLITHAKLFQIINLGARQKQYPTTLPGIMSLLRSKLGDGQSGKDPLMQAISSGKQRIILMAPDGISIRNGLKLIEEYKLNAVLLLRQDVEPFIPLIKRLDIPVIWGGTTTMPKETESTTHNYRTAARLYEAGIRFCLTTGYMPESRHVRRLPVVAALCVAHGLPIPAAIDALTINTAKILGLEKDLGSIEPGKRADLIICDQTIVHPGAKISQVIINGQIASMKNNQTELYQKFDQLVKKRMTHK